MVREAKPHDEPGRGRRLWRVSLAASVLLAVVLFATACSGGSAGPGVAGQGSSSTPSASASPSGDPRQAELAYARCMREHGIADFPDPEPGGGIAIQGGGDLDLNNPQFKAADDACKSLLPPPPSQEQQQQEYQQMLAYAKCMREHGFPDFPDPKPGEGISIDAGGHPELDPNNPRFQAANEACGGPSKGNTNTQTNGGAP